MATTFRRQYLFDGLHPCYAGDMGIGPNPKLLARVKGADLVLLIGGRLSEMATQGYTLLDIPEPQMKLVHVHPGPRNSAASIIPTLAINAAPTAFCSALEGLQPPNEIAWQGEAAMAHADYLAWSEKATPQPGAVNLGEILVWLRENLTPEAIITNGAGNFAGWIHRFYRFRKYATHVAPTSGSMGYGFPAAVAMKLLHPDRDVVCIAGDGDFLMTGQDFATAVQYKLPVIVVLADNGLYGTIRMHQEREYPGRVIATHCTIRISSPMPWRSAASARWWRRPPISRQPSPRRGHPASRRSSISRSIRKPSQHSRRFPPSATRRSPAAAKAGRIVSPKCHRPLLRGHDS